MGLAPFVGGNWQTEYTSFGPLALNATTNVVTTSGTSYPGVVWSGQESSATYASAASLLTS